MTRCEKCGTALQDNHIVYWKCTECDKAFKLSLLKIQGIGRQKSKIENENKSLLKCPTCGKALDNGNEQIFCKCSSCENVIKGNLQFFTAEDIEDLFSNTEESLNPSPSLIKCPECGKEINDMVATCPECGHSLVSPTEEKTLNNLAALKNIRKMLLICMIVCFIVSIIFFAKSYDVKNEYYNSDVFTSLNKNAYVGGDAYNYIINGTYFTGYSIIASNVLLGGILLLCSTIVVTLRIQELE